MLISLLLSACSEPLPAWNDGTLVFVVPETSQGAKAEFERDLAQLFAKQLNVKLKARTMSQEDAITALREHRAHMAAISQRPGDEIASLQFGPSYQSVRELVVCNSDIKPPRQISELTYLHVAAIAGSPQEVVLREAKRISSTLRWESRYASTPRELLEEVSDGNLDCAATNELQLADAFNYYPNLVAAFDLDKPSRLSWGFPGDADPELLYQSGIFFARIWQDGTIRRLLDRYYGHIQRLDKTDAAAFIARAKSTLPRYRQIFEEAAAETGFDWKLLAALAYQESQWNPLATSYTNVRGMMMLTEDTADRMNVANRLDPRESIFAGARYLALLREQLPDRIREPDRTWLALAAYNKGFGHLEDARILTSRAGLNPDSWADVKKWMPRLNQPGYYETLKRGFARGGEAVILVESIRSYYDMLKRIEHDVTNGSTSYSLIGPLKRMLGK